MTNFMKLKGSANASSNKSNGPLNEWIELGSGFVNAKGPKFGGWIEVELPYGNKQVKVWASITRTSTGNLWLTLGCPGAKALDQHLITEQQLKEKHDFNKQEI